MRGRAHVRTRRWWWLKPVSNVTEGDFRCNPGRLGVTNRCNRVQQTQHGTREGLLILPSGPYPARVRTRWTPIEETLLLYHYGSEAPGDTVDRLGRTRDGLRSHLRGMGYAPALAARFTTCDALATDSGYYWSTLLRWFRALDARSRGGRRGSRWLFTEARTVSRFLSPVAVARS